MHNTTSYQNWYEYNKKKCKNPEHHLLIRKVMGLMIMTNNQQKRIFDFEHIHLQNMCATSAHLSRFKFTRLFCYGRCSFLWAKKNCSQSKANCWLHIYKTWMTFFSHLIAITNCAYKCEYFSWFHFIYFVSIRFDSQLEYNISSYQGMCMFLKKN